MKFSLPLLLVFVCVPAVVPQFPFMLGPSSPVGMYGPPTGPIFGPPPMGFPSPMGYGGPIPSASVPMMSGPIPAPFGLPPPGMPPLSGPGGPPLLFGGSPFGKK